MINEAKIIIQQAEKIVFGKAMTGIPKPIENFFTGFYFIYIGLDRFFLPVIKFLKIFVMLFISALLISYCFNQSDQINSVLFFFSVLIPISLVVFARPNTYCFESVSSNQIVELANIIQVNGIMKESELSIFKEVIEMAKERVERRNKHFYWLFITYVAVCIFMFDLITKISFNLGRFDFQAFINTVTLPVMLYILFTPLFFVCVHSYKKACDAVFQLISLSIFEVQNRNIKQFDETINLNKNYELV